MNETAKKLREAAAYIKDYGVASVMAIARVRDALGVGKTDTTARDLGAVLDIIADELDELQARAAEVNNLRQQLESAEKKAERRKQHIGYLETALHDKNALLEQRGGTIARLTAECSELRKQAPSERERQILALWPRFEDGEYVWFGDVFIDGCGYANEVRDVRFDDRYVRLVGVDGFQDAFIIGERVKRPVQSVLDADGVEIEAGDTVYGIGRTKHRFEVIDPHHIDPEVGEAFSVRCYDRDEHEECHCKPKLLTHTRPDSWERLEEDAVKEPCDYFGVECDEDKGCSGCPHLHEGRDCTIALQADLIRRAKALAGVEVGR